MNSEQAVTKPVHSDSEDSLSNDVESLRKRFLWFVIAQTSSGQRLICTDKNFVETFRNEIQRGALNRASPVEVHDFQTAGWIRCDLEWTAKTLPLAKFVKKHPKLGMLYEPIASHARVGLKWGAWAGGGWLFLMAFISFFSVDWSWAVGLALTFLGFALVRWLYQLTILGTLILAIVFMVCVRIKSPDFLNPGVLYPGVFASIVLFGPALGSLPGMAVGGFIGLLRKRRFQLAPDARPEKGAVLKKILLPLMASIGFWIFMFGVVSPWVISVVDDLT